MAGSGLVMLGHVHIVLAKPYHYSWQHFPFKLCQRLNRQFVGSKQTIRCACFCMCVCVCVCVVESVPNDSAGEEPALFEGTDSSHKAGCAYIPRVTVWTQPANDQNARRGRINCSRPLATGQGREGCGSPWVAPCTLLAQDFRANFSQIGILVPVHYISANFSFFVDIRANFSEIRITSQCATCKATWTESPSYVHLFNLVLIFVQFDPRCLCILLLDK